jgi:hypothetical protein
MIEFLELKTMTASQAKAWFKFRVRMAPFGENFRGGENTVPCPLCKSHPKGQAESFHCADMKKFVNIRGQYQGFFSNKVSSELIQTVYMIYIF